MGSLKVISENKIQRRQFLKLVLSLGLFFLGLNLFPLTLTLAQKTPPKLKLKKFRYQDLYQKNNLAG